MITAENGFITAVQKINRIVNSGATWKLKYDRIFKMHSTIISPILNDLGLCLEWYDPDTSYEEDVLAYVSALLEFKDDLEKTF